MTAVLSTAGGVAFVGDMDRVFRAVDVKTGKVLWETRLGTSVQGFPHDLQRRRQAVRRGLDRPGRRQPAHGAEHARARRALPRLRERAVRVRAAVNVVASASPTPLPGVILLVDDSELVRGFAKDLLLEAAHEVLEADDAPAALIIAEKHVLPIDLLITDLLLPGPSGVDLARKLRAFRPNLKVLLVSADSHNAAAAALIPGARFMEKSHMVDELAETVAQLLSAG